MNTEKRSNGGRILMEDTPFLCCSVFDRSLRILR